jgi:DNA polymerase/3'-5' exonuclease PolX
MRLADARRQAATVLALLEPGCDRMLVCGSVRREKPECKDIEIVVVAKSKPPRPVFGEANTGLPPLEALLDRLIRWGELKRNLDNPKYGAKYKTLKLGTTPIDLFVAKPDNWGNLVAIRTGDGDFSRMMVTRRCQGGLLPDDMGQRDGYLYNSEGLIPCPEEDDWFFAITGDVSPSPPPVRCLALAMRLRAGLAQGAAR